MGSVNTTVERIVFEGVDNISAPTQKAKGSTGELKRALGDVQNALAAIGVTAGAGAFVKLHLDALHAVAALDDMAESTGASVEALSAIQRVAKVGGADFEGLTGQLGKMVKGLKEHNEEGSKASQALALVGLRARDTNGRWRDTGELLIDVSRKLGQFRSDADRVAFIQDVLGKGAERYLPLLKDMAEGTDLHATVTAQQAAEAEKAEKNINRLKLQMEDARKELVNEFTPAIIKWTDEMLAAQRASGGLFGGLALYSRLSPSQLNDPYTAILKNEQKIMELRAKYQPSQEEISDPNVVMFGRTKEVERSTAAAKIAQLLKENEALRDLMRRRPELAPGGGGGAMDMGVGLGDMFSGKLNYTSPDERRLKPSEIAKKQAEGQEAFSDQVRKSNAEMTKYLDDDQKKSLKVREDGEKAYWQMLSDLHDREQERAVEEGQARLQVEAEKKRFREENFGVEEQMANDAHDRRLGMLNLFTEDELNALGGRQAIVEGMEQEHQARLLQIERNKHAATRQMQMAALNNAVGLLQLFAGKSKEAALAVIAIEKGLRIAETISSGAAAEIRALAELGPIEGAVAAGAIRTWTYVNVGLIAAQGLVEAGNLGGGGGAIGTFAANPTTGSPVGASAPTVAAPRQSITVILQGEERSFSSKEVRELLEMIADATRDGAVVRVE